MKLLDVEKNVGMQLKMLRMSRKISQKELASKMGITYQQVQKYEAGLNRISSSRVWQICRIFNVTPNFLFNSVLDVSAHEQPLQPSIPSNVAAAHDVKLMLAFKKIDDNQKKNLVIKMCESFAA